jgi:MarR-like DNA-binding transcriptional regulator SgrR of sgrS sRNA
MRRLDARARVVLGLFAHSTQIKTPEVAQALGLSDRMARLLIQEWVQEGWLIIANPSNRARAYALAEGYRQFIGNLSAIPRKHR